MDLKLRGKGALISGSSSGIGESIARALAAEGVRVVLHGRSREKADAVATQIRAAGGEAHVAIGDLSEDRGAADVARFAVGALGEVPAILINNAGGSGATPQTWSSPLESWHALFEQNFFSAVRLTLELPGERAYRVPDRRPPAYRRRQHQERDLTSSEASLELRWAAASTPAACRA